MLCDFITEFQLYYSIYVYSDSSHLCSVNLQFCNFMAAFKDICCKINLIFVNNFMFIVDAS